MLKVLIVEDEDIIRRGMAFTIDWVRMKCVVVGEAENGKEGLEKILELSPDIVITDLKMPIMGGIEMIRKASENRKFKSIILTSYADFDYAKQAIDLRVNEYLLKPLDEEKLRFAVQKISEELKESEQNKKAVKINFEYYMKLDQTENQYVAKAVKKVEKEYSEKISIESISEELGVSSSYLTRKFKDITGHTFLDFLNKYRVQQAVKLLITRKYRVYEISDMVGFSSYKHFCAVFKKYTYVSPTGFLKAGEESERKTDASM